jgi:hypothetical protein
MFVIMYSDIYLSFEQINSVFCFCINIYSLKIIGSKPIEFFLEYSLQNIIRKLLLHVYIYFRSYIFF